jgi:hypothetical protein
MLTRPVSDARSRTRPLESTMKAWIGAVEANERGFITSCARSDMSRRNCSPLSLVTTASSVPTNVMMVGKRCAKAGV